VLASVTRTPSTMYVTDWLATKNPWDEYREGEESCQSCFDGTVKIRSLRVRRVFTFVILTILHDNMIPSSRQWTSIPSPNILVYVLFSFPLILYKYSKTDVGRSDRH